MEISYDSFADFCKTLAKRFDIEFFTIDNEKWNNREYKGQTVIHGVWDNVEEEKISHVAFVKYVIGGQCGGTYGDYAEHDVIADDPLSIDSYMFEIIRNFKPELSFIDYNNVIIPLIENEVYCDSGYYGNYQDYLSHAINIRTLYDALS